MPADPPRRRPRRWLWFFVLLTALSAAAVAIPLWYNLGLQLSPEQVEEARARWRARGPADYDLEYAEKIDPDTEIFVYRVKVRGGRATAFSCNGAVELSEDAAGLALGPAVCMGPAGDYQEHTMDGLFRRVAAALEADRQAAQQGGRRNYATATFDPNDGHLVRYIHRTSGSRERVEWNVKLLPVRSE